jgi:hypothetical protein
LGGSESNRAYNVVGRKAFGLRASWPDGGADPADAGCGIGHSNTSGVNLDEIKAKFFQQAALEDISEGGRDRRLIEGMRDVPVKKILDAIDYIDKNLLPAVKKKGGDKSADFLFFSSIVDYLLWAVTIADRYDALESRWVRQKLEIQLLKDWNAFYEGELQKYTTLEDLLLTDALDRYADAIKKRSEDLKKRYK